MNTKTTTIGTAGVVVLAQITNDKKLDMKIVVGLLFVALVLAVMGEVNAPLAENFGTLIFVTALLLYLPAVTKGLGLTK